MRVSGRTDCCCPYPTPSTRLSSIHCSVRTRPVGSRQQQSGSARVGSEGSHHAEPLVLASGGRLTEQAAARWCRSLAVLRFTRLVRRQLDIPVGPVPAPLPQGPTARSAGTDAARRSVTARLRSLPGGSSARRTHPVSVPGGTVTGQLCAPLVSRGLEVCPWRTGLRLRLSSVLPSSGLQTRCSCVCSAAPRRRLFIGAAWDAPRWCVARHLPPPLVATPASKCVTERSINHPLFQLVWRQILLSGATGGNWPRCFALFNLSGLSRYNIPPQLTEAPLSVQRLIYKPLCRQTGDQVVRHLTPL